MTRKRTVRALCLFGLSLLVLPPSAQAAFPGKNGKIAFTTYGSIRFGQLEFPNIISINPDGTGESALTSDRVSSSPAWSPDGSKIAFDREAPPFSHIYTMNADGNGATQLTSGSTFDQDPAWSPDGSKIVFARITLGGRHDIYTMNADGSGVINLTNTQFSEETNPVWSPLGNEIAFQRGFDIQVMRADGTGERLLVTGARNPNWSPDGQRIVFDNNEVHVINADGTGRIQLTNEPPPDPLTGESRGNLEPVWSPDGTKILYVHATCPTPECNYGFETINVDGSGRTPLPLGYREPDWQPLLPPEPQRGDYKNAAQFCKALREFLGDAAFRSRFGGGANAHGKCVSGNH